MRTAPGHTTAVSFSLAGRIFSAMILASLVISIATTGIWALLANKRINDEIETTFRQIEKTHCRSIGNSLWESDQQALTLEIDGIRHYPHIVRVSITAGTRELASVGETPPASAIARVFPIAYRHLDRQIPIGTLVVHVDRDAAQRTVLSSLFFLFLFQAAVILISALAFFALFQRMVTRNLSAMGSYLTGLTFDTMNAPLILSKKARGDELDMIASAINGMRLSLLDSYQKISEYNATMLENNERFQAIFNSVNEAIFIQDLQTLAIRDVNQGMCRLFGYTRDEAINLSVEELSAGRSPYTQHEAALYAQKAADGEPQMFDWQARHKNGHLFWVCVNMCSARVGENMLLLATVRDITERKVAEQALLDSEQRFSDLVEFLPDPMFAIDRNGTVIVWNQALEQLTGMAGKDIIGHSGLDAGLAFYGKRRICLAHCVLSRDETLLQRYYPGIAFTGDRIIAETYNRHLDSNNGGLWSWVSAGPFYDSQGNVAGAIEVVRDITERKQIEDALKRSEARYRTLFQGSQAAMLLIDPDTARIVDANPAACAYYGHDISTLRGLPLAEINTLTPAQIEQEMAHVSIGQSAHFLFEHRLANGERHPVEVFTSRIELDGQNLLFSIIHDITERRKAEEEVSTLNRDLERRVLERTAQLEEVNRELNAFSYSVSHDLQAPLRAIDSFSRMLMDDYGDKLDKDGNHLLQRVLAGCQRMRALIDGLLGYSRISRQEIVRRTVDLSGMAQEVAQELQSSGSAQQVTFIIDPELKAEADPLLMRSVLDNLLGNAFKFTASKQDAQVRFGKFCQESIPVFYVKDNGAGFDMNFADKLFAVFQRLHSDQEFPGTGIGLATVKRIVERHGGKVWAEGTVGKGAVVYFTLPEPGMQ